MKLLTILSFVVLGIFGSANDVGTINKHKKLAEEAFAKSDFAEASKQYEKLVKELYVTEPEVLLNLGHSYFKMDSLGKATDTYSKLTSSQNKAYRHTANNQLGVIYGKQQKYKEALGFFKEALKADPANENTRYNYELTKKLLQEQEEQKKKQEEEQKKNEEQQQQQDQGGQKQEQKEQQGEQNKQQQQQQEAGKDPNKPNEQQQGQQQQGKSEQQQGKQQQMDPQRMKEIKISPERAQMILDAMKNQEVQYYQNMRRKKPQSNNTGKPDW